MKLLFKPNMIFDEWILVLYFFYNSVSDWLFMLMIFVIAVVVLRLVQSIGYDFKITNLRSDDSEHRKKQTRGILLIDQVVIWLGGVLFLIDNLGYDITTFVAGSGIGGIAIALAVQTILGDLFSYLVIFFDKPFETGDFIIVEDKMGTVEYIGIKTTRIRTPGGEQLICSNKELTKLCFYEITRKCIMHQVIMNRARASAPAWQKTEFRES